MVQPVAVTNTFMVEGYAIRWYKRILQGGSAAATEVAVLRHLGGCGEAGGEGSGLPNLSSGA
jgi:pyocin large subunit-like protein